MSRQRITWRSVAYLILLVVAVALTVAWWPEFSRIWREHFATFLIITLLMIVSVFVQSYNFLSFLPGAGVPKLVDMAHTWAIGALVNYLGPFQPGLAVRVALLAKQGVRVGDSSVATLRQVIASAWLALALASVSLMWMDPARMAIPSVVLMVAFLLVPQTFPFLRRLVVRVLPNRIPANVRHAMQVALTLPSLRAASGILVQYMLGTFAFYIGYKQFGADISIPAALGLACVVYVSSLVALFPGNLGVLEALCTAFGQTSGLSVQQSLALAFLYRGASIASVMLVAAVPTPHRSVQT